jgi:large subunit ribosomal protein L1
MAKLTKKAKEAASKLIKNRMYSLKDAAALIKVVSAKFDESVDIAVRLCRSKESESNGKMW